MPEQALGTINIYLGLGMVVKINLLHFHVYVCISFSVFKYKECMLLFKHAFHIHTINWVLAMTVQCQQSYDRYANFNKNHNVTETNNTGMGR